MFSSLEQIVNATRTQGTGNVTFVYTITKNGTQIRSEEAVRTLGLLSDQEMALKLGYVVAEKASSKFDSKDCSFPLICELNLTKSFFSPQSLKKF